MRPGKSLFTCPAADPPHRPALESADTSLPVEQNGANKHAFSPSGAPAKSWHPANTQPAWGSPVHRAEARARRPHLRCEHRAGGHGAFLSNMAKYVRSPGNFEQKRSPKDEIPELREPSDHPAWWFPNMLQPWSPGGSQISFHKARMCKRKKSSGGVLAVASPKPEGPPLSPEVPSRMQTPGPCHRPGAPAAQEAKPKHLNI